ncbi:MAG TPA: rhodanese-like domain-containing protein [Thermoleophilaceae bacterium]
MATIDDLLERAREDLQRVTPEEAAAAVAERDALLLDIRADSQRAADGTVPQARFVARNVLEWRLDPACEHRDPDLASYERPVILMCNEGYQSSLAAATLRELGVDATDMVGGFQAWRDAGLPTATDEPDTA